MSREDELAAIERDESFYEQLGLDGMMEPLKVLVAITDCEIRRRRIMLGID